MVLDLKADRYLMLRGSEAEALEALGRDDPKAPGTGRLTARRLVDTGPGPSIVPVAAPVPVQSALELAGPAERAGAFEIARYRLEASLRLRLQGLEETIAAWRRAKSSRLAGSPAPDFHYAGAAARGFASARVQLPWRRLCVPDSLALARFLWRRRVPAEVYFGVRLDPFAAHAWVQLGDMILSDNVNVVADYTPVFRL